MPSLITEKAKVLAAMNTLEMFKSDKSLNHYMFAADHIPFDNDNFPTPPDNSEFYQHFEMARKVVFGKRIGSDDVSLAIKCYPWESGTVYAAYDDKDPLLYTKKFYCISQEGSEYSVFKCLYNNKGNPSTSMPKKSETNVADDLYRTDDLYVWKYLYSVQSTIVDKFKVNNEYFPFVDNQDAIDNAIEGAIHSIEITAGGSGYNNYAHGSFRTLSISGNNLIHSIQSDDVLSANTDFYKMCSLYITSGTGAGQIVQIDEYIVTGSDRRVLINSPFDVMPDYSSRFVISPMVKITGDGQGAQAIVSINSTANTINSVDIIDVGSNYTIADVEVINSLNINTNTPAVCRAIISPMQGHGANLANELFAKNLVISTTFDGSENNKIPVSNDYRLSGVVVNPEFANTVITVDNSAGFIVGRTVTQDNGFTGKVTAVGVDGTNTVRLSNVKGMPTTNTSVSVLDSSGTVVNSSSLVSVDRDLSLFDNRGVFAVEPVTPLNQFISDEKVIQKSTGAYGYLHEVANDTIYLSGIVGDFSVSDFTVGFEATFEGETSKAVAKITGYVQPALIKTRGEFIYIQSAQPIERSEDQKERLKIVVEF